MIQPVHSKGDQPWVFFGRNDAEAETPVLWPPHAKGWLVGKHSDAGRDWGQEEKGTTEDEMAGWHRWLNGHESQWTLGVGDGQRGLACCDSWGRKESDTTEWLIWSDLMGFLPSFILNTQSHDHTLIQKQQGAQEVFWRWWTFYYTFCRKSIMGIDRSKLTTMYH